MEDFGALAAALGAGIQDVRGCLILSRDGLVLGVNPAGVEAEAKHSWIRLAALGEPERGFIQFGTEIWCYVRRGPYAAFALTGTGVRPGLVIDHMEEVLLAAEEARARHAGLRIEVAETVGAQAPSSKPRVSLHPDARPAEEPFVIHSEPAPDVGLPPVSRTASPVVASTLQVSEPPAAPPASQTQTPPVPEPFPAVPAEGPEFGNEQPESRPELGGQPEPAAIPDDDVDRFSLAREFSQLLQEERDTSDG